MVQMDFLAANYVRTVELCKSVKYAQAHRADIFAIAQLSCYRWIPRFKALTVLLYLRKP